MARMIPDATWIVATIYGEARGEPQEGRIAVAEVIRNRTHAHYSSDGTGAGTVLRAQQFDCWDTHDPNRLVIAKIDDEDPVVKQCISAWLEALRGSNIANGALLYYNPKVVVHTPPWLPQCDQVAAIGNQLFFVPKKLPVGA